MHESMRPVRSRYAYNESPVRRRKPKVRLICGVLVLVIVAVSILGGSKSTAESPASPLRSGVVNSCLDVRHNAPALAVVQLWACNKSAAQDWTVTMDHITHGNNACLAAQADGQKVGSPIVLAGCSNAPGQLWLRDKTGYYNPHSQLCLMASDSTAGSPLILASCHTLSLANKTWYPAAAPAVCSGTKRQRLACTAETEWSGWQTATNHTALLDKYTGGTPYEAWCADFVSYIYKQASYAFTQGSNNGWDENIAENIQNLGFTKHYVGDGYLPQPGDVAYFDYAGGHVELVVSGGPKPTFIYGNSGQTDPTTGNGNMAANTITNDSNGKVVYYLSPN